MRGPDSIFTAGAHLFDEGRFFEAHEAWEHHWLVETDTARRLCLQGLIQIAAGFHKLVVQDKPASAERLLAKGLAKLDASPELTAFCDGVRTCAKEVTAGRFDASTVPKLGSLW